MGSNNATAVDTLLERTTRFTILLPLPLDTGPAHVSEVLIDKVKDLPVALRQSLTWDQGQEMQYHSSVTVAAELPIYFAHPHSPWERGTNENTNGLLRQYPPKNTKLTSDPAYLQAIAFELNNRTRKVLGFRTPKEAFTDILNGPVA